MAILTESNKTNNNRYHQRRGNIVRFTNVVKTFDSFSDGYAELIKYIPDIKFYGGEDLLHESVVGSLISVIKKNIPTTSNPNYPNTMSISIDSHEVGFKTDSNIAFGWREVFDRENAKVLYKFRASFVNISSAQKDTLSAMEADGWYNMEFNRHRRFWDNVEGKNPRYNKKRNHLPEYITPKKDEPEQEVLCDAAEFEDERVEKVEIREEAHEVLCDAAEFPEEAHEKVEVRTDPTNDNPMAEAFREAQEKANNDE